MMDMLIYTIRDATLQAGTRPMFFATQEQAVRAFSAAVSGGDQNMTENCDDFTLYKIGSFNDESQLITGHDPERVVTGFEALAIAKRRQAKLESLNKEIQQLNGVDHAE